MPPGSLSRIRLILESVCQEMLGAGVNVPPAPKLAAVLPLYSFDLCAVPLLSVS
jgi:hypothetical protein